MWFRRKNIDQTTPAADLSDSDRVLVAQGDSPVAKWALLSAFTDAVKGLLGTAADYDIGTSGAKLGLLNTANTYSAAQTFSVAPVFNALPTGTAVSAVGDPNTLAARDAAGIIFSDYFHARNLGYGWVQIGSGDATQTGLIGWFTPADVRLGYMGFSVTDVGLNLENGANFFVTGGHCRLDATGYLNWGSTFGSTGYGLRINSGALQFKNSGGAWRDVATSTGITDASDAAAGSVGEYISAQTTGASATVTVSIASPAVVTWGTIPYKGKISSGANWTAPIVFSTTDALPTGLTASTVYWIIGSSISGNTHQVATSIANALAGTAIVTTGSQSGTHTGVASRPMTTDTAADVVVMQLPAGDWDVFGNIANLPAGSTVISYGLGWTHTVSATAPISPNNGAFVSQVGGAAGIGVTGTVGSQRINVSTATPVYLGGKVSFTISTLNSTGFIGARRKH